MLPQYLQPGGNVDELREKVEDVIDRMQKLYVSIQSSNVNPKIAEYKAKNCGMVVRKLMFKMANVSFQLRKGSRHGIDFR